MKIQATTPEYRAGIIFTARSLGNGLVAARLGEQPESRPQLHDMMDMQLNSWVWLSAQDKEDFRKRLAAKGTAEVFLPRNTSKFFAG